MCDHCGCREYGPIAELTGEHEEILSLAWRVAEESDQSVVEAARVRLRALLDIHVVKEETALYPLLLEHGDLEAGTAAALEDEHRALHAALADGPFDRRAYYALAAHIEQEEMELFPEAMFAFDDDEWDEVDAAHRRAEAPHEPAVAVAAPATI